MALRGGSGSIPVPEILRLTYRLVPGILRPVGYAWLFETDIWSDKTKGVAAALRSTNRALAAQEAGESSRSQGDGHSSSEREGCRLTNPTPFPNLIAK